MPTPLPQISSRAYEHPADRAALEALRAIPGFDEAVRRVAGFITERGVRQIFLANAVQVGAAQRPALHALLTDACTTMDWRDVPELYVTQSPRVNAFAVGFEHPFIVVHSGALELLESDDERRFLLGHELGHIMSGHMTYRTIALILIAIGTGIFPFPLGVALLPFQLALLEWHRKSELSTDRAALLAVQDHLVAQGTFMKLAGGRDYGDVASVDAFMAQAARYETGSDAWDRMFKVLNTAFREHPFNTVRAGELERWRTGGGYDAILAGDYPRRGDAGPGVRSDMNEAGRYYRERADAAMSTVRDAFDRARDAFEEAFKSDAPAPPPPPPAPQPPSEPPPV